MSNEIQRRLKRSKASERELGRHLISNDGVDPRLTPGGGIASSTGRVGHITGLQYDVASKTYAAENKQVAMPMILFKWWLQICQVAKGAGKEPLLRWEPSNEDAPRGIEPMIVVTQSRHTDLLSYERLYTDTQDAARRTTTSAVRGYSKEQQTAKSPGRGKKGRYP